MHGNVWEWVQDCYGGYDKAPTDGTAASGKVDCSRVLRGGSWNNDPRYLRAAQRGIFQPVDRDLNLGFRLARTLNPTPEPLAKRRKADRLRVVGDRLRGALSLLVMT